MHPNLVGNVRTCVADVSVHFPHDTDVFVAVQQRVFFIPDHTVATAVRSFVGFEAGVGKDDDEPLSVFVCGSDGNMLLSDQLGKFWWWA